MRIKTLENIIDSVDPYFILKDLGFSIGQKPAKQIIDYKLRNCSANNYGDTGAEEADLILKESTLEDLPVDSADAMEAYYAKINGNLLRVLPFGYLNIDTLFQLSNTQEFLPLEKLEDRMFVAGTSIDMLAYYMRGDYTKAFKIFFKYI